MARPCPLGRRSKSAVASRAAPRPGERQPTAPGERVLAADRQSAIDVVADTGEELAVVPRTVGAGIGGGGLLIDRLAKLVHQRTRAVGELPHTASAPPAITIVVPNIKLGSKSRSARVAPSGFAHPGRRSIGTAGEVESRIFDSRQSGPAIAAANRSDTCLLRVCSSP
jgi:hypothetical protein